MIRVAEWLQRVQRPAVSGLARAEVEVTVLDVEHGDGIGHPIVALLIETNDGLFQGRGILLPASPVAVGDVHRGQERPVVQQKLWLEPEAHIAGRCRYRHRLFMLSVIREQDESIVVLNQEARAGEVNLIRGFERGGTFALVAEFEQQGSVRRPARHTGPTRVEYENCRTVAADTHSGDPLERRRLAGPFRFVGRAPDLVFGYRVPWVGVDESRCQVRLAG